MLEELAEMMGFECSVYGDTIICPCGNEIEMDGRCYCGEPNPLEGMI